MPSIERKLAAIMFTDIAGFTQSMSHSETKSLDLLEKKRSILKPLLKEYKGTFMKEIGDGTLSYFDSVVNAATCGVKLQETTYDDEEMNIRVGIHIGDIVFKEDDVFGDGIGSVYCNKGEYDKSLDCYKRSFKICEELDDNFMIGGSLSSIGGVYLNKGEFKMMVELLEKSLSIQKKIGLKKGGYLGFKTTIYLYLSYKNLGKDYDGKEIHRFIKEAENIEFELNLRLYELLEDKSYLEAAYNQIKEKVVTMEDELKAKFLSYPIPKAIVDEWKGISHD